MLPRSSTHALVLFSWPYALLNSFSTVVARLGYTGLRAGDLADLRYAHFPFSFHIILYFLSLNIYNPQSPLSENRRAPHVTQSLDCVTTLLGPLASAVPPAPPTYTLAARASCGRYLMGLLDERTHHTFRRSASDVFLHPRISFTPERLYASRSDVLRTRPVIPTLPAARADATND